MVKTLILYNRLDTTKRVFEKISEVQPTHLFIAADAHRELRIKITWKLLF